MLAAVPYKITNEFGGVPWQGPLCFTALRLKSAIIFALFVLACARSLFCPLPCPPFGKYMVSIIDSRFQWLAVTGFSWLWLGFNGPWMHQLFRHLPPRSSLMSV